MGEILVLSRTVKLPSKTYKLCGDGLPTSSVPSQTLAKTLQGFLSGVCH